MSRAIGTGRHIEDSMMALSDRYAANAVDASHAAVLLQRYAYIDALVAEAVSLQDFDQIDRIQVIDWGPTYLRDGCGNYMRIIDFGIAVASSLA